MWGWKLPSFWVLGGVCLLLASLVLSLHDLYGSKLLLGLLMALILYLLGGLLWIAVAVAVKQKTED